MILLFYLVLTIEVGDSRIGKILTKLVEIIGGGNVSNNNDVLPPPTSLTEAVKAEII